MECVHHVKDNGVVYGIKGGRDIKEGEGHKRPFGHIDEKIIRNTQKGIFSGMMFSVSQQKTNHKTSFLKNL